MFKPISFLTVIFLCSCSATQEVIRNQSPISVTPLPAETILASTEQNGIQIDILHCYGNPESKELTLEYRIKNWGASKNYVVNAKGNSIILNGNSFANNCANLNGEEQCGIHFSIKIIARQNLEWKGSYVFKNVTETAAEEIETLTLRFMDNQIQANEDFAVLSNIPITWDANYLVNESKKTPRRSTDDNNGLIMQIEKASLNTTTRELELRYTVKNLSGEKRKFYVNARDNILILNNTIHTLSCAGIESELKCDIHWTSGKLMDLGETLSGTYIFKNVKNPNNLEINKLQLRYSEDILNLNPYYAIFGKIPVEE